MKKLFFTAIFSMASLLLFAQEDVTQFMGIPIDGYKHEMIQKLKEKGFVESGFDSSVLQGEFNGNEVYVAVQTNNNKVWRIAVLDANDYSEGQIKIRYNNLCGQFRKNSKYDDLDVDQTIPDDEDISYEILVNKKQYQAQFYQKEDVEKRVRTKLLSKYTEEQLNNPTEEIQADIRSEMLQYYNRKLEGLINGTHVQKLVWFTINMSSTTKFSISMFYENGHNKANGEEL